MKCNYWVFVIFTLTVMFQGLELIGQEEDLKYGKTPDKIFPYNNFQKAYIYHFIEPIQFLGAGRDKLPPKDLKEVRLGFLGPLEGSPIVSLGEQMFNGSVLAIEEANKAGGYNGIPFKLMIHNDVGLWGAAANEVVAMNDEKVWAWLGSIDDIVSHGALRATLKMEMNVWQTPITGNLPLGQLKLKELGSQKLQEDH